MQDGSKTPAMITQAMARRIVDVTAETLKNRLHNPENGPVGYAGLGAMVIEELIVNATEMLAEDNWAVLYDDQIRVSAMIIDGVDEGVRKHPSYDVLWHSRQDCYGYSLN